MHRIFFSLLLVCCTAASATTLKIATLAPDGTDWMNEMRAAGDRIKAQTQGRVELKFYPGGVMGNAATVRRKIRVGQLSGGAFTGGELALLEPDVYLLNIPFLYRNEDEVNYVREKLDGLIKTELEQNGWALLGLSGAGFGYLMSAEEVTSNADLAAQKVWLPEGDPIASKMLNIAGVNPVMLPLSDVYTGLQTGLINAVVNSPVGAIAFQWHTRLGFIADLPVTYITGGVAVDIKALRDLSAEDRQILETEMTAAMKNLEDRARDDNVEALSALENQGLERVSVSADELEQWYALGRRTLQAVDEDESISLDHLDLVKHRLEEIRGAAAQ